MRYFTREWYDLMQRLHLHSGYVELEETANFDENLFIRLYKIKESEYIELQQKMYATPPLHIHIFIDDIAYENFDFVSQNKRLDQEYEQELKEWEKREPLGREYFAEQFNDLYSIHSKNASRQLKRIPNEILNEIADLRVFILGYATKEIIKKLEKQSNINQIEYDNIRENYENDPRVKCVPREKIRGFGFHDFKIYSFVCDNEIKLDVGYKVITFKEAKIIEAPTEVVGKSWEYSEVYKIDDLYEIHIFLSDNSYLTISCEDFTF